VRSHAVFKSHTITRHSQTVGAASAVSARVLEEKKGEKVSFL
jgi:hypothetical protein